MLCRLFWRINEEYYGLNVYAPPEFILWNPNPNVMVLGSGAFEKWLGHAGSALMKGINTL